MTGLAETAPLDELLCATGFASPLELRDLLALIPLETAEQRFRFDAWLERDGTKSGLLRALSRWPRRQ